MDDKRFVRLLGIAKAALVAILVYVGFEVATNRLPLDAMFDPGTARGERPVGAEPTASPPPREISDYTAIVRRNLFSGTDSTDNTRTDETRVPALESPAAVEELGLRLVGTIAGGPLASRAIIQNTTTTNSSGSYRIGDAVASATVEAIQRDAVVLRHQGRPVVLRLSSGTAAGGPSKAPLPENRSGPRQAPRLGAKEIGRDIDMATPPPGRAEYVTEVFRRATVEPYVKDDQTIGLKITGLDQFPMAGVFGFKDGDIVQTVNGQQLTSKQKAFQILMKAKTQPRVDIQLLRDGKSKELSFDL
ncbi:MAG: hypothetical protein FJ280_05595 [Planctomycetes bacterium]|nr:hypothetical protein [Planctomycetota bacterium]